MRVGADGYVEHLAGSGSPGWDGDGGMAVQASLRAPWSVTGDALGQIYVADAGNRTLRRIGTDGIIVSVPIVRPGSKEWVKPFGVFAGLLGELTIADTEAHAVRQLDSPSNTIRVSVANARVPADGSTFGRLSVLSAPDALVTRLLYGDATVIALGRDLDVRSTRPGTVLLSLERPGAWPVAIPFVCDPTHTLSLETAREMVIANGDDVSRLVLTSDTPSYLSERAQVNWVRPDGTVLQDVLLPKNQAFVFDLETWIPGEHQVSFTVDGAEPVSRTLVARAPEPWELADSFEPDGEVQLATVRSAAFDGTLHTPADVDWMLGDVREGFVTELTISSDADVRVRAKDSAESANQLRLGPDFGLNPGDCASRLVEISAAGRTARYSAVTTTTRSASFGIPGSPFVRANGSLQIVPTSEPPRDGRRCR